MTEVVSSLMVVLSYGVCVCGNFECVAAFVYLVPRVSLLCFRWSLEERPLVAADHVTTCDTNVSTGVESTNNFFRPQLKRKKGHR